MDRGLRAGRLPAEQLQRNFSELLPPMTPDEALAEANRCLFCYDAPCIKACPTHINIPGFIKKIATGNLRGSARTILESNFLGATCARVCPVDELCEGACVMHGLGDAKPIEIGRLQRYAMDYMMDRGIQIFQPGPPNGRRVACVGGGPASLSCAAELARLGYQVTVLEKRELAGGLDTFGIVVFREPMEISLQEVQMAADLGVEIRTGVEVGRDVSVDELLGEHDAVFLGIGRGRTSLLGIPGEDLEGVYDGLDFIESTREEDLGQIPVGSKVAVIGAGNTAVDVATVARRLGAERVLILYRRGEEEMTSYDFEYEFAKQEGVEYRFFTVPKRILGQGRVEGIECLRTQPGDPDESGRRRPVIVESSEHVIEADMVVRAIGQNKYWRFLDNIGLAHHGGSIEVDPETGQTSHPKIFAGGDCILKGQEMAATVVATQHGKIAARGIHRVLEGGEQWQI